MTKKIDADILDELLKDCGRPEDLLGDGGLMQGLKRALMQRMLGAELTEHLGYEHGEVPPPVQPNRRNGASRKTVKGETGAFEIDVPRDREGSFEPRLIGKGQTRIDGLDDKIIAMYACGMSVRDIRSHLEDLYGIEVSPDLISRVTDAVLDEVKEWRSRALDAVYPVVIFDALRVKIRDKDSRIVRNKAVYLALGITAEGTREVLGLWIAENEGAKFWLGVMTELRNRGSGHPDRGVSGTLCIWPPARFRCDRSQPCIGLKRSSNIMANWLTAVSHPLTFRDVFSWPRMAR